METCSLSKYAGFTGVRLGWTVVPEALKFADGTPVIQDFNRVMSTCFNGASVISQAGAIACMSDKVLCCSLTHVLPNCHSRFDSCSNCSLILRYVRGRAADTNSIT